MLESVIRGTMCLLEVSEIVGTRGSWVGDVTVMVGLLHRLLVGSYR